MERANYIIDDKKTHTPLLYSIQNLNHDCFLRLIECGADPRLKDQDGFSATNFLSRKYNSQNLTLILKAILEAQEKYRKREIVLFHTGLPYVIKNLPDKMKFRKPKP